MLSRTFEAVPPIVFPLKRPLSFDESFELDDLVYTLRTTQAQTSQLVPSPVPLPQA